jgi:hypothetical protein
MDQTTAAPLSWATAVTLESTLCTLTYNARGKAPIQDSMYLDRTVLFTPRHGQRVLLNEELLVADR